MQTARARASRPCRHPSTHWWLICLGPADQSWARFSIVRAVHRAYKSGQQSMRVAVYGTKHDAATFERLLRDICVFEPVTQSRASAMIDTAVLGCPKVGSLEMQSRMLQACMVCCPDGPCAARLLHWTAASAC